MTTRQQKFWIIALVATVSLFLTACKKDISLPNPNLEKIFGTWNWMQSSGGFVPQTTTPATEGYSQTVEFKKNGVCIWRKNGKHKDQMQFSLTEEPSIYNTGTTFLIKYKDTGLFDKNNAPPTQSIKFGEQDTLFPNDEANDAYEHVYLREK